MRGNLDRPDGTLHGFHQIEYLELSLVRSRLELLSPILALLEGDRNQALKKVANQQNVSERTVYRWMAEFAKNGIKALLRSKREDYGSLHIPPDSYQLIYQQYTNFCRFFGR